MPEIIIVKNEAEAGEIYGRCVADLIKAKPDAVLGLATGSSPLAAYQALAKIVHDESIDVSQVSGYALDEYIGLPLTHPESYHATIHRTVVEPLGLDPAKVHVPGDILNGTPLEDGDKVALAGPAYDHAIEAAGGIDVQILGIGTDWRSVPARPKPSRRRWKAACPRSARLPRCRCTRTPRLSWTRRPPLVCATRTTIATLTPTSRPGRASELSCAGFPLCVRGAVECNETEGGYRRRHMCIASRLDHPQSRFASQLPLAGAHER